MYTDGASFEEQSLCITERYFFSDLVEGLSTQCPCGKMSDPLGTRICSTGMKINVKV